MHKLLSVLLALSFTSGCDKEKAANTEAVESRSKKNTETKPIPKAPVAKSERAQLAGVWHARVLLEGDDELAPVSIPFALKFRATDTKPSVVVSGDQEIAITKVAVVDGEVSMNFVPYNTAIVADLDLEAGKMQGAWSLPWVDGTMDFAFTAIRAIDGEPRSLLVDESPAVDSAAIAAVPAVGGVWEVSFPQADGTTKLCGARFEQEGANVTGAVVAPTGDYGRLSGSFRDGKLRLYNFDGAFAYEISADAQADGTLAGAGQFNLFQQKFSARHIKDGNLDSELPKCAEITEWSGKGNPLDLKFTDLAGNEVALADAGLKGKVVLFDFFGTWCPNCHQLIPLLRKWHELYKVEGLEIIGVGFEFADGQDAVAAYRDEHKIPYRLFVGAAPQEAANIMPQVALTSFPTLMLVGRDGKIHSIQTGFRGPATGDFRAADEARFEARIKKLLAKPSK